MKDEMEPPAFDLRVRTKEFALRIVRMFVALPKTEVARVLGKQVRVNHSLSCPSFIPHNSSFIIAAPAPGGAVHVGKSDNAPSMNR